MQPPRNSHKDFLKSQTVVRKRRRRRLKRLILRAVLLLFLFGAAAWALWLPQLSIAKVVVAGTSGPIADDVQQKATSILDQKYFGIIPKRNYLFYPKKAIIAEILKEHPEIGSASAGIENFSTLNIRVAERMPAAYWCQEGECYVMDNKAYIYALASSTPIGLIASSTKPYLSIYDTASTTANPIGTNALDAKMFAGILSTAAELSSSSLPVESVSITGPGEYAFKIQHNGNILFSDSKPFEDSYQDLISALHSPVFSNSATFQYIDTRFGNKVFYRLGSGAVSVSATSTVGLSTSTASSTPGR